MSQPHNTPLIRSFFKACRNQTSSKIQTLLTTLQHHYPNSDLLNTLRTSSDETPLLVVITHNPDPFSITQTLLKAGSDPNIRGHGSQLKTPLYEACRLGNLSTVRLLLSAGAKVDAIKSGDWTSLMIACAGAHPNVVAELLQMNARIELMNREGATALHMAARAGCSKSIEILLKGNVLTLIQNVTKNGRTPLHYAARAGKLECVKLLVKNGAWIQCKESSGMMAIHDAAAMGHEHVVEFLGRCKDGWKDLVQGDCGGLTVLHHSVIGGYCDVVKIVLRILKEMGSKRDVENWVNLKDRRKLTALDVARLNGKDEIMRIIEQVGKEMVV